MLDRAPDRAPNIPLIEDREGVKMHTAEPIGRLSSSLCAFMCLACPLLSYLPPGAVTYQSAL